MKNPRYLFRLNHSGRYRPPDVRKLLNEVLRALEGLPAEAQNLRVASQTYELDVYVPEAHMPAVKERLGSLSTQITVRCLDAVETSLTPEATIKEARILFDAERYWEAHEVLEPLWKSVEGQEKRLIQGIILAAAALVHVQKDEMAVVPRLIRSALERFENQPANYHGFDVGSFERQLKSFSSGSAGLSIRMEERV